MRAAALSLVCLVAAGCGASPPAATTAPKRTTSAVGPTVAVAVLGRVPLPRGARLVPLARAELVLAARPTPGLARLAQDHPDTHFALVGYSFETARAPNLAGLLFRDDEAAYVAGVVAGTATVEEGAVEPSVAWVGGRRPPIVDAFAGGVRSVDTRVRVLEAYSEPDAALCKEAALEVLARGASVVFAGKPPCADGALAAATEQNAVGLSLADFQRPEVAVNQTVRDALNGVYHGGEDVVFGAASGAIGLRRADPRISADAVARAREAEQQLAAGLRPPR